MICPSLILTGSLHVRKVFRYSTRSFDSDTLNDKAMVPFPLLDTGAPVL